MKHDLIRRRSRRAALIFAASTVFGGFAVHVAVGQTYTYTGPTGGNWSTTTNWTSFVVPGSSIGSSSDTAQLGGGSGATPVAVNFNYSYDAPAIRPHRVPIFFPI